MPTAGRTVNTRGGRGRFDTIAMVTATLATVVAATYAKGTVEGLL